MPKKGGLEGKEVGTTTLLANVAIVHYVTVDQAGAALESV